MGKGAFFTAWSPDPPPKFLFTTGTPCIMCTFLSSCPAGGHPPEAMVHPSLTVHSYTPPARHPIFLWILPGSSSSDSHWIPVIKAFRSSFPRSSAGSTPGGALPSIPLSFGFAAILPPEAARGVIETTPSDRWLASFRIRTTTVSDRLQTSDFRS